MRRPLTYTPPEDPLSSTSTTFPVALTSAWWRLTYGSSSRRWLSSDRPIVSTSPVSGT